MAGAAQKTVETEVERLILWRYENLVELGFSPQDAVQLVEIQDVVHEATLLVEAGCPLNIALELLKKDQ